MEFRLLHTGFESAAMNMAIDESVLEHIARGESTPTLRLYGWRPPAVSIGYFQSLDEEVDREACKKFGIDVVRRMTGGGAVFHDKEITYSIHIPMSLGLVPADILESYRAVSNGVIFGLRDFGLDVQFVPLNDLILNGKKISGNAQTRKKGVILQHGTILLEVDVEKMFSLLKVPNEKLKGKLIADVKERVTSLSAALGREGGFEEALPALQKGFAEAFPESVFEAGGLSASEQTRTNELAKEKYWNDAWNRRR